MLAWYFAQKSEELQYGDNRKIVLGETHKVDGPLELCKKGLHASERLLDALKYAPGNILFKVRLEGELLIGHDKVCATERTYIQRLDATEVLQRFARRQAMINISLIEPYCSAEDYTLILRFLANGEKSLSKNAYAADHAAVYAAANAATNAADAADCAAYAAAYAADCAAYAATNAADAAANADYAAKAVYAAADYTADYTAAYTAANEMLTDMVEEAFLNV